MHSQIISLKRVHKNNLTPLLFIEVHVPHQESERSGKRVVMKVSGQESEQSGK
jgi:hypothetical protein